MLRSAACFMQESFDLHYRASYIFHRNLIESYRFFFSWPLKAIIWEQKFEAFVNNLWLSNEGNGWGGESDVNLKELCFYKAITSYPSVLIWQASPCHASKAIRKNKRWKKDIGRTIFGLNYFQHFSLYSPDRAENVAFFPFLVSRHWTVTWLFQLE